MFIFQFPIRLFRLFPVCRLVSNGSDYSVHLLIREIHYLLCCSAIRAVTSKASVCWFNWILAFEVVAFCILLSSFYNSCSKITTKSSMFIFK